MDQKGRASTGILNELLTGEKFNVTPYGVMPSNLRQGTQDDETDYVTNSLYERTNQRLPDADTGSTAGNRDDHGRTDRGMHGLESTESTTAEDPRARTIVPMHFSDEDDPFGAGNLDEFASEMDELTFNYENPNALAELEAVSDEIVERLPRTTTVLTGGSGSELAGYTDIACPICFGTGWVGGYSIHNGFRIVKSVADQLTYDSGAYVDLQNEESPGVQNCSSVTFSVVLPLAVGIDAVRAFSGLRVLPATITVDGTPLNAEHALLPYCNGKVHTFVVSFSEPKFFTHFEIQLNQSKEWALFELPKLTRSGNQTVMDDTDPFSVTVSPMIPFMGPKSIIAESTYGKVLLVKTANSWNDRNRTVLGWECEVRVVQSTELWTLLPKRLSLESPNRPAMVRDNTFGPRRT